MATQQSLPPKHSAPLATRMRPRTINEIVGQKHLLTEGSALYALASPESQSLVSVILWGPPGTGKTTLAHVVSITSQKRFVELSAVTAGVKDVRSVMQEAQMQRDLYNIQTVLFLDEIHRFSKAQQDALLPGVENGWVTLMAATTENPSFSVITPLLSRSLVLKLEPLSEADIKQLVLLALESAHGLSGQFILSDEALTAIINFANGDARRALTLLEASSQMALAHNEKSAVPEITEEMISKTANTALLRYDKQGDEHYDVISAFIKSIRGSDPDAAIHYLARMIAAGEDPRFIARRLIISAAEDIGLADPTALSVANAAANAVSLIGMPEGRIPLAEATIYLATAPKSNRAYIAINSALADVEVGKIGLVPAHLRDAHYPGAKSYGHGSAYLYPHDDEVGVVQQEYLPEKIRGIEYYRPTEHGYERELSARLKKIRAILGKENT